MRAHRESNADLLLRSEAPEHVSANGGQITHPTLDVRRARFREYLDVMRWAWTQERFSYAGTFYTFRDVELIPKPCTIREELSSA